jgi:hypothetical protein
MPVVSAQVFAGLRRVKKHLLAIWPRGRVSGGSRGPPRYHVLTDATKRVVSAAAGDLSGPRKRAPRFCSWFLPTQHDGHGTSPAVAPEKQVWVFMLFGPSPEAPEALGRPPKAIRRPCEAIPEASGTYHKSKYSMLRNNACFRAGNRPSGPDLGRTATGKTP